MRGAVVLLMLAACDHAGPRPSPKPDPIKLVHDEFELLPASAAAGTDALCPRVAFAGDDLTVAYDKGAFIGRLRALFGPRDGDVYPLRHVKTGVIITAFSTADSGPYYGGTPDAGYEARRAADPVLSDDQPARGPSLGTSSRHDCEALAGARAAAAMARLDALLSQVSPADFAEVEYSDANVWRIGVSAGRSFRTPLAAPDGMAFLLARSKPDAYEPDVAIIEYYLEHESELPGLKPKVLSALAHVEALAPHVEDPEERDELLDDLNDYRDAL